MPETWLWLLNSVRGSGRRPKDTQKDLERMKMHLRALLGGAEISGKPGTSLSSFK